jgi:thiamine kinase-like enzyme
VCEADGVEDATSLTAEGVARLLGDTTGLPYRPLGRLPGGESGAHKFLAPDGSPVVVKWDSRSRSGQLRAEAVILSERLRTDAGWPVPAQFVIDVGEVRVIVQEFMPGDPPDRLDDRLLDQLLDLHDLRIGLARPGDPVHWPDSLIATLTEGGEGYCIHSSLRDFDSRTRTLVERIEKFGNALAAAAIPGGDIVHWDLHLGNLLTTADGALTAVVDTDFALIGDAKFDLVALAIASMTVDCDPGVRARLFSCALDDLDDLPTQAYLAHFFLRLIDWPIRRGRFHEVDLWLQKADELLRI